MNFPDVVTDSPGENSIGVPDEANDTMSAAGGAVVALAVM